MEVEGKFNYTTFSFNSTSIYYVPDTIGTGLYV